MKYDVIIAGGGASGMTAAITAARRGSRSEITVFAVHFETYGFHNNLF